MGSWICVGCWIEEIEDMSDLSIYELEDINWDEFGRTEDHIVPHSSDEISKELSFPTESRKKPKFEEIGASGATSDNYAANCVSQENEERDFSAVKIQKNTILEKGSWSPPADEMFSASCDTDQIKEVTSVASENYRMSSQGFKSKAIDSLDESCSDNPVLSGGCYGYQLNHTSQTENDFHFIDNAHDDREASDLLYYNLPDIETFEDDGSMFRECAASFALGSNGNEDEVSWLSASDVIEGYEDPSRLGFKFACPDSNALTSLSEDIEPSSLQNGSSSVNDSNMKSATVDYKASSWSLEMDEPASLSHFPSMNGYSQHSGSKNDFTLRDQGLKFREVKFRSSINQSEDENRVDQFHEKQQKQKERKRKDKYVEYGDSIDHFNNLQNKGIHSFSGNASHKDSASIGVQQQKQNLGSVSFGYLDTNNPYMQSDRHQSLEKTTVCPQLSGIKSENSTQTSLSQNESSHGSNGVLSMKNSHDFSFEGTDMAANEMKGNLHHAQGFQVSFDSSSNCVDLASIRNPASVRIGNNFHSHSEKERVTIGVSAESGPVNSREASSTNSGLDEVPLEISGFRQLQQVIKQLDTNTKLCIRDSLYRLARSAAQRHNYANLNGGPGDDRDARIFMVEGTNKCNGLLDIETDTNPIDRTMAHLLFHQPSDTSIMPSTNVSSLKSQSMVPGSVVSPPTMVEKLLSHEAAAGKIERKVDNQ